MISRKLCINVFQKYIDLLMRFRPYSKNIILEKYYSEIVSPMYLECLYMNLEFVHQINFKEVIFDLLYQVVL